MNYNMIVVVVIIIILLYFVLKPKKIFPQYDNKFVHIWNKTKSESLIAGRSSGIINEKIILYLNHGGENLKWKIVEVGNGYVQFYNKLFPTLVMSCQDNTPVMGSAIVYNINNKQDNQIWKLVEVNNGFYKIFNKKSPSLLLDFTSGKPFSYPLLSNDNQTDEQLWNFKIVS